MTKILSYCKARHWCHQAHAEVGQTFENKTYGEGHLDMVAASAVAFGFGDDPDIMMACQAHDVPEDTRKSIRDMYEAGFPATVCAIVQRVTDPPGLSREEAKKISLPIIAGDRKAIIVKCLDRHVNGINSRRFKPKKFERYCLEYPEFRRILRDANDFELAPLWASLDNLFGFKE